MSKKAVKVIAALLLICVVTLTMTACAAELSGTYTNKDGLIKQSFTFKDDGVVEMSAFGIDIEGTYVIKGDRITITYILYNLSYDWEKSFKKDGDSIFIGGTEFTKE